MQGAGEELIPEVPRISLKKGFAMETQRSQGTLKYFSLLGSQCLCVSGACFLIRGYLESKLNGGLVSVRLELLWQLNPHQ